MCRGSLAKTWRVDVQSHQRVLMGETESTGAAGEHSKARRNEKPLQCEWMMELEDSEGRDRGSADAI